MTVNEKAQLWLDSDKVSAELKDEIKSASKEQLNDMFFKNLEFGTGGMRGLLGPGPNRMNIFTVTKVTVGFAKYLLNTYSDAKVRGVVLSHDNRINSRLFVLTASKVLNDFGINTYIFDSLRPTPELSFATRYVHAVGGIMVTASHNPKEYNGYKVYDDTGCQLVPEQIQPLLDIIANLGDELTLTYTPEAVKGEEKILSSEVDDAFMQKVHSVALNPADKKVIKIVFTPQHGTSSVLGRRLFKELGYEFYPVLSQCDPDPLFSNTLSPNPEKKEAYTEAIKLAKQVGADLILTTDPDADRCGLGYKMKDGEYRLLTGNETGALLIDYVLSNRYQRGLIKSNSVICDTIVTSTLGEKIAAHYGVGTRSFLTGFKYIGSAINRAEKTHEFTFEFGYEESYGYIFADFCRDKDSLESLLMIAEMTNHYALEGKDLGEKLEELYKAYGYHICKLYDIYFEGESGLKRMAQIMDSLRNDHLKEIAGVKVVKIEDYELLKTYSEDKETDLVGFPKSNVLKFFLEDGSWIAVRPSGTEPKCKFYYEAVDTKKEDAIDKPEKFHHAVLKLVGIE